MRWFRRVLCLHFHRHYLPFHASRCFRCSKIWKQGHYTWLQFSSYSGGYGGSTDLPYSDNYRSYGGSQSCGGVYPIQNRVRSDFLHSEDDNIPFAAHSQEVIVETSARSDFLRNEDDNMLWAVWC